MKRFPIISNELKQALLTSFEHMEGRPPSDEDATSMTAQAEQVVLAFLSLMAVESKQATATLTDGVLTLTLKSEAVIPKLLVHVGGQEDDDPDDFSDLEDDEFGSLDEDDILANFDFEPTASTPVPQRRRYVPLS